MPEGLTFPDPDTGQGNCAAEYTFGAQGAVVRIERHTGELTVLNLIMAIDAGRVINPTLARGQIVGAMVQEMGGATTEELIYSPEGRMRNNSLTDYKIPTPEDVAATTMDVVFLETPEPIGPFGARGIAEHGTVGITAAIGNAVSDALGIEIKRLPITNEKIYQSMAESREGRWWIALITYALKMLKRQFNCSSIIRVRKYWPAALICSWNSGKSPLLIKC